MRESKTDELVRIESDDEELSFDLEETKIIELPKRSIVKRCREKAEIKPEVEEEEMLSDEICIRGISWAVLKWATDEDNFDRHAWFREYTQEEKTLCVRLHVAQRQQGNLEPL